MLRVEVGLWSPNRGSGWAKVIEGQISRRHRQCGPRARGLSSMAQTLRARRLQDQRGEAWPESDNRGEEFGCRPEDSRRTERLEGSVVLNLH